MTSNPNYNYKPLSRPDVTKHNKHVTQTNT